MPGNQTAGWRTGGAGGRQMENQMENCISVAQLRTWKLGGRGGGGGG